MTVKEFIDGYENSSNKENYLKKRITTTYVPYENKVALCDKIIDVCFYIETENGTKIFKKNTPKQYMNFILLLIDNYTDIDIDFENSLVDFNLLEEKNYTEQLLECIPNGEYGVFNTILKMCIDDRFENERTINTLFENISIGLELLLNKLDS